MHALKQDEASVRRKKEPALSDTQGRLFSLHFRTHYVRYFAKLLQAFIRLVTCLSKIKDVYFLYGAT